MSKSNIINIIPQNKEKETLEFLKQAIRKYNLQCFYVDESINRDLTLFELMLKSLTTFYLLNYEHSHYFGESNWLKKLNNVINVPNSIFDDLIKYQNYSKKYLSKSKYGKSGLKYDSPEVDEISKISKTMFDFAWENLQSILYANRRQLGLMSKEESQKIDELFEKNK